MLKKSLLPIPLLLLCLVAGAQLQSPDAFLPHSLGETFTPHHLLVDYVQHVAENSPNVELIQYGTTWEGRPLFLAFISTPENLARLEEIRLNNLRITGLHEGAPDPELHRAIVWLSYSVHGNEAAGSESSMAVLHELADPGNARTQAWLENTIVIIDPSINPDGYSRYTHWYRAAAPRTPNPKPETRGHLEPWPGGRTNHYYFDLNRDWAWQTQQESRHRIEQFARWMPHVHVDVHEQGYDSPYYFAPAAKPYHTYISQWQRNFQYTIGKNNAKYFDQNGWLYFTRERFDLLYPSYGDTYPTYNGAIGMTYEQAGIRAGRAILTEDNDTLTLHDRILHHKTTSLATIEVSSQNAGQLIQNFSDYFQKAQNEPVGQYKTFIISSDNPPERLHAFRELLDRNHIQYGQGAGNVRAYNYRTDARETVSIGKNDLLVSAYQPRSVLAQILLEPQTELEDSLTYDITAWSLPYAYGLEAYASTERVAVTPGYPLAVFSTAFEKAERPYAYLAEWRGLPNARFLSTLLQRGVTVRYASTGFSIDGQDYTPGTLVITRSDNRDLGQRFDRIVSEVTKVHQQALTAVQTGFSDSGPDLGSGAMRVIRTPKVAVLYDEPVSSYSFGQVWYYLERDLHYPVGLLPAQDLSNLRLDDYNLLILPEGRYRLDEDATEQLNEWIRDGGRLIAIGSANRALANKRGFGLKNKGNGDHDEEDETRGADYAGQERRYISRMIPGAVFKVKMDNSHPLGFGQGEHYFSLKTDELSFAHLEDGWNVGTLGEEKAVVAGFAGYLAKEAIRNSLVFGVEDKGRGSVVYLIDNPLYRAFWENGKFLFSNALFMR